MENMMDITTKSSFVHGAVTFKRGAKAEVSDITGKALIGAGLAIETVEVHGKQEVKPAGASAPKLPSKKASNPERKD